MGQTFIHFVLTVVGKEVGALGGRRSENLLTLSQKPQRMGALGF